MNKCVIQHEYYDSNQLHNQIGVVIGLLIIAFSSGGIKSNVSSFVGDQFVEGQEELLESVFGLFYFAINTGSLIGTTLNPILREHVSATAAFAVPAIFLPIATIIIWLGRKSYRMVRHMTSEPDSSLILASWS